MSVENDACVKEKRVNKSSFHSTSFKKRPPRLPKVPLPSDTVIRPPSGHPNASTTDYYIRDYLGSGAFSSVYAAIRKVNKIKDWVAVKIVPIQDTDNKVAKFTVENEVEALMKAGHHPSIVCLLDYFHDKQYAYLILELCECKSLSLLMREKQSTNKRYCSEHRTRTYMKSILEALQYLHSLNIMHRDIKLNNVFVIDNYSQVKIADFGMSVVLKDAQDLQTYQCGTPSYVAPEIVFPEIVKNQGYGLEIDIFSAGICMFNLLTGKLPFTVDRADLEIKRDQALVELELAKMQAKKIINNEFQPIEKKQQQQQEQEEEGEGEEEKQALCIKELEEKYQNANQLCHQTDIEIVYQKLFKCDITFPPSDEIPISSRAKQVCLGMLQKDPKRRWTIHHILNHSFFTGCSSSNIEK